MKRNKLIPLQVAIVLFFLSSCDVLKPPPKPPGLKAPASQKPPPVPQPNAGMLPNGAPVAYHISKLTNSINYFFSK